MRIGVPLEIKDDEGRVALTPIGVHQLVQAGHQVMVQAGAGVKSGFANHEYQAAGAMLEDHASAVYGQAELVVKVKEPIAQEFAFLQPGQILFTYLHLAAALPLLECLKHQQITAIAYETVQGEDGHLPLLQPMSLIAGNMSIQLAAQYLTSIEGGKGLLLSRVPGVPQTEVVILGGGIVGTGAAQVALGMGANVVLFERSAARMDWLAYRFPQQLRLLYPHPHLIEQSLRQADVLIGAVLIPGDKAPRLISKAQIGLMKSGSVIIDVAVDQGGCIETIRPTTHQAPVYRVGDVIHYGVTNMPGAVPQTATWALTQATFPYVSQIAELGLAQAAHRDKALAAGINVQAGKVCHPGLLKALSSPS